MGWSRDSWGTLLLLLGMTKLLRRLRHAAGLSRTLRLTIDARQDYAWHSNYVPCWTSRHNARHS